MDQLQLLANLATIFGFVAALVGLVYAGLQLRKSARVAEGEFMLNLETLIDKHDAVHIKLRPDGTWTAPGAGPESLEDWVAVEDYMVLFEHCEILMRYGSLNAENFASLFAYRVENILRNEKIVTAKFESEERVYWKDFLSLVDRLKRMGRL